MIGASKSFDFQLGDMLSELEQTLDNDGWTADILQLPKSSDAMLRSFFDPARSIQVYDGTEAEHKSVKRITTARFLKTIRQYPDWLTTAAFYVAVQLVEMMLAERSFHSSDHFQRKKAVRENFPRITRPYNLLYNASLVARYDSTTK